jgi:hypothetical protein
MHANEGVGALTILILAGFFALFGASARVLQQWPSYKHWAVIVGSLMANTLAGMVVGLIVWEWWVVTHPTWLCAAVAVAGWTGNAVLDRLSRKWILPVIENGIVNGQAKDL